jgi:MYXO-CTERM domain-containing protein
VPLPRVTTAAIVATVLLGASASTARAETFRKGPYLQWLSGQGVVVMWESDDSVAGRVVVHPSIGPDLVLEEDRPGRMHEVHVTGLRPGKRYEYRVECGGKVEGGEFATAPPPGEAFSFVVFGDTRSNAGAHKNVVERVRREVPDFILATGDMVNEGTNTGDWQIFFDVERELLRDNALFPAIGNHDREPRPARTVENYRKYFAVPDDSPDPERYYAFTYSNARFLVLDSNLYSFALTDQTAWIERELTAAVQDGSIRHIFVVMHHPPFSTSIHGGNSELREMWTPLFEKYRVEAVFSGHDHTYEHGSHNGVQYIVSGGGGAPLYPKDPDADPVDADASRYFERTYNFLRVQVVGDFVEVAAMRDDGTLIESWGWGRMPEAVAHAAPAATPAEVAPAALATTSVGGTGAAVSAHAGCTIAPGTRSGSPAATLLALLGLAAVRRSRRRQGA